MMIRGSWTRARAIAVRCCSPPESWVGIWSAASVSPTSARTRSTAGRIQGERDVLPDGLARQQLEVLEDGPDLAPDPWHLAALDPGEVVAVDDDVALCCQLVADQQLHQRGLAGARRPDEEHEVALGDHEIHVLERLLAVRVALRHVVEHDDGVLRPRRARAPGEAVDQRGVRRGRGGRRALGCGHALTGAGIAVTTPTEGTIEGATFA
jgi:hypothetical protein